MIRFAKSRLASIAVPGILALGLAGSLALGTSAVASASAQPATALVLTSSATAGAVDLVSAPGVTIVRTVPSSLAATPNVVIVVGFGPSALSRLDAKIRAVAPSSPIVAISLPRGSNIGAVSQAVYRVLGGFNVLAK